MAGIENGELIDADELMNSYGANFNDTAQMIFNADYIGFDSRLTNSTTPSLKNVKYSTFTSDDADETQNMTYDSTNDLYVAEDQTDTTDYYIDIEATSLTAGGFAINNCKAFQVHKSGTIGNVWRVTCDTGTAAVKKAQVIKTLFYGTNGSDPSIIDHATSVTALKSSDSADVGRRVHFADMVSSGGASTTNGTFTGTFADTSTNTACQFWSYVQANEGSAREDNCRAQAEFPSATTVNSVNPGSGSSETSDETGTDTTGDNQNNPADCQLQATADTRVSGAGQEVRVIVLCKGDITWVAGGADVTTNDTDFVTDHSMPLFTAADLSTTVSILIFKDTVASTDNAIAVINSQIDATSSEQISISANGGSNYTDVNNAEIARPTAGTALWRRIVITRTDLSKEDKVTEQAVKHSFY